MRRPAWRCFFVIRTSFCSLLVTVEQDPASSREPKGPNDP